MRDINTIGYSLVFILPWVALLAGIAMLLVPRRALSTTRSESPRRAA